MRDRVLSFVAVCSALAGPTAAGCFFTSGINSEPQAQVETTAPGPYYRGEAIGFSAYKSDDPDGDLATANWSAFTCSRDRTQCDAPAFATRVGAPLGELFEIDVPLRRTAVDAPTETVSVSLTVFDEHGASHQDRLFVDISNRLPVVELQVQGARAPGSQGYSLGSYVRVVARHDEPDGDGVVYAWAYTAPVASQENAVRWSMIDSATYELEPDVEGLWTVEVTATDEVGGAGVGSASIEILPDALPCIASTDPPAAAPARYIVDRDGAPRRFSVLGVTDDLDAYPPRTGEPYYQSARFRWQMASPDTGGALVDLWSHDQPDVVLDPSGYAPGDVVTLRVEIDDRKGRDIVCGADAPTCSLAGDGCLQRVTWEAEIR